MRDWTRISDLANVEDIVGCWIQDVLVVEARNKSFFGCHLAPIGWTIEPYFKNSIDKVLADLAQISYRTLGASMKAKQRTLGGDIANLWRTKVSGEWIQNNGKFIKIAHFTGKLGHYVYRGRENHHSAQVYSDLSK